MSEPSPSRYIGLDIHKHYFVAVGVDLQFEGGTDRGVDILASPPPEPQGPTFRWSHQ